MARNIVSGMIPNMINGISQQPFSMRLASQAEYQINGYPTVAQGLIKRPPTQHIARLMGATSEIPYLHLINRDPTERYQVVITNGDLKVFTLDGEERTVSFPDGKAYLNSEDPNRDFRCVTIADYTFVLNRQVNVGEPAANPTAPQNPPEALIWFREGNYSSKYEIKLNRVTYIIHTPSGTTTSESAADRMAREIQTNHLAETLDNLINSGGGEGDYEGDHEHLQAGAWLLEGWDPEDSNEPPREGEQGSNSSHWNGSWSGDNWVSDFEILRQGSVLRIRRKNGGDFDIEGSDSLGDQGMAVIKEKVQTFATLPKKGIDGFQVKIEGDPQNRYDTYYVQYEESGNEGIWREIPEPGRRIAFRLPTMPHVLVREADGTFTFRHAEWERVECGDDVTNPFPSFVGKTINDLFFYKNRLGVIADENVVFSRNGDFFNFFRETVTSLVDTDPVDVAVSHTKVSILKYAVPFSESLLLFSDQTQFILPGNERLTPATASIAQTTEFNASDMARPQGAGRFLYFLFNRGPNAGVREYYVDRDFEQRDAVDLTANVPKLMPQDVFTIQTSTNEDLILLAAHSAPNRIYTYKWFYDGEEKVQSAWDNGWVFGENDRVVGIGFLNSSVYLGIMRDDGLYLERMDLDMNAGDLEDPGFRFLMDRNVSSSECSLTYDEETNETVVVLPYRELEEVQFVSDGNNTQPIGYLINSERVSADTFSLRGDWTASGASFQAGRMYEFRYRFSPFLIREEATGGGLAATTEGRLQLSFLAINHADSGYFRVEYTPVGRDTYTRVFTGRVIGSIRNVIGKLATDTGRFTLPVFGNHLQTDVEIINDKPLPCRFLSAEWEGKWTARSSRRV